MKSYWSWKIDFQQKYLSIATTNRVSFWGSQTWLMLQKNTVCIDTNGMNVCFFFVCWFFSSHIEIFSIKWYGDVTIPLWKALNFGLYSTLMAIEHGLLPHARQTLLTSAPPSRLEWMNSNEWTPRKKKNDFCKALFCCSK